MNNKVYFIRLMLLFMSDWTINWSRTDSSASFIRRQLTFYKASSLIIDKRKIGNMITLFMQVVLVMQCLFIVDEMKIFKYPHKPIIKGIKFSVKVNWLLLYYKLDNEI